MDICSGGSSFGRGSAGNISQRRKVSATQASAHPTYATFSFQQLYVLLSMSDLDKIRKKHYNSEDSLMVTHPTPTTNSPSERTGRPVLHTLWSYVVASTRP